MNHQNFTIIIFLSIYPKELTDVLQLLQQLFFKPFINRSYLRDSVCSYTILTVGGVSLVT